MKLIKENTKKICVLLAMVLICATVTACGEPADLTADYAVGIWSADYTENGASIAVSVALNAYGEYGLVKYVNNEYTAAEIGTYEINGNTVNVYKSGDATASMIFEYSGGMLVNKGHKFKKQPE